MQEKRALDEVTTSTEPFKALSHHFLFNQKCGSTKEKKKGSPSLKIAADAAATLEQKEWGSSGDG